MEQNIQRELIAKASKSQWKLPWNLHSLSLIVHNPQNEIFAMLIHAAACNPYSILKESCSGNNFSKQFGVNKHK